MGRPKLERPNYRLERNAAGIWVAKWTENRIPHSWSTRTRVKAEADILYDQWLALRDAPALAYAPRVNAILDHYLADRRGQASAYATLVFSAKPLRRHLGNLLPDQISRRLYWDRRKRDLYKGRHPSAGTIIREGVTLRAAFELAAADRLIPRSSIPVIALPPAPKPRSQWLTKEQAAKLLSGARQRHIRLFIFLALATGGRKEAIESLTWEQVDFWHGTISLDLPGRAASRKRRATVPMSEDLKREMEAAYQIATSDYVLERASGPIGDVKKGFAAAVERAGIPHCTPHILRHTCATWMVMDGIPLAEVARFLGDTEATIERVYGKHSPDYLRRAAKATEFASDRLANPARKVNKGPFSGRKTHAKPLADKH